MNLPWDQQQFLSGELLRLLILNLVNVEDRLLIPRIYGEREVCQKGERL